MKTIAFFGHRLVCNKREIKNKLIKALKEFVPQGFYNVLIGCHGDFDKLVLETCLNFRDNIDKKLIINVVLTSLSMLNKDANGISRADVYTEKGCNTLFYNIEEIHFKQRITYSNKKIIDNSDVIICYVDINVYKSGAKTAMEYALCKNKKVINLF